MSEKKLLKSLRGFDIYGHEIEVNYQGDSQYRTLLGAMCTLAIYSLILFNGISLFRAFRDGSK